jgi:hypothetical protein
MIRDRKQEDRWDYSMWIDAKGFLSQFNDALKALQQPEAGQFLKGTFAAKGKTVAELVKYMKDNGLKFAPAAQAVPGCRQAYLTLFQYLRDYDTVAGTQMEAKQRLDRQP